MKKYFLSVFSITIILTLILLGVIYRDFVEVFIKSEIRISSFIYQNQEINEEKILSQDLSQNSNFREVFFQNLNFYIPKNWAYLYSDQEIEIQFTEKDFALIYFFKKEIDEETQTTYLTKYYETENIELPFIEFNPNQIQEIINLPNKDIKRVIEVVIPNELIPTHEDVFPRYRIISGKYELEEVKDFEEIKVISYKSIENNYVSILVGETFVAHIFSNSNKINELNLLLSKIENN